MIRVFSVLNMNGIFVTWFIQYGIPFTNTKALYKSVIITTIKHAHINHL